MRRPSLRSPRRDQVRAAALVAALGLLTCLAPLAAGPSSETSGRQEQVILKADDAHYRLALGLAGLAATQGRKRGGGLAGDVRFVSDDQALASLAEGTCCLVGRLPTLGETLAAAKNGHLLYPQVIGYSALRVVVHPENTVGSLSAEQLKGIYAGGITNWKEVGGPDMAVEAYDSPWGAYAGHLFRVLVMEGSAFGKSVHQDPVNSSARPSNDLPPGGIRFLLWSSPVTKGRQKPLRVDGVEASEDSIARGSYPLRTPCVMITMGCPRPGTVLHDLSTAHLTRQGEKLLRSCFVVPMTEYARPAEDPPKDSVNRSE